MLTAPVARGDQLVVALSGQAVTKDPHLARTGADFQLFEHIYDTLVTRDGFRIAPRLAKSWTSADLRNWTFRLQPDATFSNGASVSGRDVAYSLCRHETLTRASGREPLGITRITTDGGGTVMVTLDSPYRLFPAALSLVFIVNAPEGAGTGPIGCDPAQALQSRDQLQIGSGPFVRIDDAGGERQVVLTPSPYCWSNCPVWERLILRTVPDARERVRLLVSGAADVMEDVAPTSLPYLNGFKGIALTELPTDRTLLLTFNLRPTLIDGSRNPLADVRVRRAIALVVDRHVMVERGLEGLAGPAWQLAQPGMEGYLSDRPHPMRTDIAEARNLLIEAGYSDGVTLDLLMPVTRITDRPRVADTLSGMLRTIGINLTVTSVDATFVRPRVAAGDFSLMFSGLGLTAGSAMEGYASVAGATEIDSTTNPSGYRNPDIQTLLRRARSADPREIPALTAQATSILERDLPMLPLMHIRDLVAHRAGLRLTATDTARAFGRIVTPMTAAVRDPG